MTTPTTVQIQLQIRADTAANWTSVNPLLLANEVALETDTKKIKVGDGSTYWSGLPYFPSIVSGGTLLGNLEIGSTGTLTFEGATANTSETTLGVVDPTADRTILLPDQSGTVVVSGNASITNADIAANAEIAVSKLANGTANQVLVTDGTDVSWSDNLTLAGDLTVNGTTTTINTQDLLVEDKNIIIGNVTTPSDVTADGGGITLKGTTDKTINWLDATDAWTSSERFSVPLGSAGAPSLTFTGDENTGIYSPGADQLALSTSGQGRLFVDASGNVGVGAVSSFNLGVTGAASANGVIRVEGGSGATTNAVLDLTGRGSDNNYTNCEIRSLGAGIGSGGTLTFSVDATNGALQERLRITAAGLVGIGTSTPANTFVVFGPSSDGSGSSDNVAEFAGPSRTNGFQIFVNDSNNNCGIQTKSADALILNPNGGNVGIGTTSPDAVLEVNGDTGLTVHPTSASTAGLISIRGTRVSGAAAVATVNLKAIPENPAGDSDASAFTVETRANGGVVSEKARIDSSGRLLVGTASTSAVCTALLQNRSDNGGPGTLYLSTTTTAPTSAEAFGRIIWTDSGHSPAVQIEGGRDGGTWTSGASQPSKLVFSTTADGASSPTERLRITSAGEILAQQIYNNTTANAANVWVSSNGQLNRSTSSGKYKTDVETLELSYSEKLLGCRPVWYRSLCKLDNPSWGYWGFIAEEVAAIDPRLVHWRTTEPVQQENGSLEHVPCDPKPEGVAYDRFVPHLLNLIKRQQQAIEDLQAEVAALKAP